MSFILIKQYPITGYTRRNEFSQMKLLFYSHSTHTPFTSPERKATPSVASLASEVCYLENSVIMDREETLTSLNIDSVFKITSQNSRPILYLQRGN